MNAPNIEKKPRAKQGPRPHIVTVGGKDFLVVDCEVRVATAPDLMRALSGDLKTATLTEKNT